MQEQRAHRAAQQAAAEEWDAFLSCTPLPDPCNRAAMNAFISRVQEAVPAAAGSLSLEGALETCQVRGWARCRRVLVGGVTASASR
jgi:hypothetical protein